VYKIFVQLGPYRSSNEEILETEAVRFFTGRLPLLSLSQQSQTVNAETFHTQYKVYGDNSLEDSEAGLAPSDDENVGEGCSGVVNVLCNNDELEDAD